MTGKTQLDLVTDPPPGSGSDRRLVRFSVVIGHEKKMKKVLALAYQSDMLRPSRG
jgi:hypothetical protein